MHVMSYQVLLMASPSNSNVRKNDLISSQFCHKVLNFYVYSLESKTETI